MNMRQFFKYVFCMTVICAVLLTGCSAEIGSGNVSSDENPSSSPVLDTSEIKEGEDIVSFIERNGYNLVWSDEFEDASLDLDNWNYEKGRGPGNDGWGNQEIQIYNAFSEDEVKLSDGKLVITASKKDDGNWYSGRIKTQRRMQFRYGYVEASLLLPQGSGMWPAFWMLGCDQDNKNITSWPLTGEFDIMEYSPATQGENRVYSTLHTASNNGGNGYPLGEKVLGDDEMMEYHRFGLLWTEEYIEIYYDGVCSGMVDCPSDESLSRWPFNEYEAFILLNLAVGGVLGGPIQDMGSYTYLIDYVRLYQTDGDVLHIF